MPERRTVLEGRYKLIRQIGEGGFSRAYLADDLRLGRRVIAKILRTELTRDQASLRRFEREAKIAAQVSGPNLVDVYDYGTDDEHPVIISQWIDGVDLSRVVRKHSGLRSDDAISITLDILGGLETLHAAGIQHRDVKPSNVLLPDDGGVKLADFGIAADLGSSTSLTGSGQVVGSPRYLAPERVDGEAATAASDVYAAGIVLYELLAGRVPFAADTPVATAVAHQQQPVPPLTELAPNVPAGLAAVAERALAKDPAQRFTSAASMRSALLEACDDEGLLGHDGPPPTPRTRPDGSPSDDRAGGHLRSTTDDAVGATSSLSGTGDGADDAVRGAVDATAAETDTGHAADADPAADEGEPPRVIGQVPATGDPLAADQPLTAPTPGERIDETTMALSEDGAEHATTVPDGTPPPTGRRKLPRWFAPIVVGVLLITAAVLAFGGDDVEPSGLDRPAEEVEASGAGPDAAGSAEDASELLHDLLDTA